MKPYHNWDDVFALAKPMPFHAFNTGRIRGTVKVYTEPSSFPEHMDNNTVLDYDIQAFHFQHPHVDVQYSHDQQGV